MGLVVGVEDQNPERVRSVESHLWQRAPKMGHPRSVVRSGKAGSLRRGLRGAEAPLFHGCAGVCGGISEQRPSGAEACIFSSA